MTHAHSYVRPDGSPARILVVDDEKALSDLLAQALRYHGWELATANNRWEALDLARHYQPDAVILDIQMPGLDGIETLARLRKAQPRLPVLFLTARDAVEDRVAGLRAGADDYVTKPFDLNEVAARVDALLRRSGMAEAVAEAVLQVGDLTLNGELLRIRAGEAITLTNTEFEVLRYLMENPNIVLSKSQILDRVWSYDFGGQSNVVELYVSYLRKKIDKGRAPVIHTVRGAGYLSSRSGNAMTSVPQMADEADAASEKHPRSLASRAGTYMALVLVISLVSSVSIVLFMTRSWMVWQLDDALRLDVQRLVENYSDSTDFLSELAAPDDGLVGALWRDLNDVLNPAVMLPRAGALRGKPVPCR